MADSSKAVVQRMIDAICTQDFETLRATFAPEVSWWITGNLSVSGETRGREEVMKFFTFAMDLFREHELTVSNIFAEGDHVAVEWRVVARNVSGTPYDGRYAIIVEVRDGLVCRVREYLDTQQVGEVLLA